MAKRLTAEQARELSKAYQGVSKRIDQALLIADQRESRIRTNLTEFYSSGCLSRWIQRDFNKGVPSSENQTSKVQMIRIGLSEIISSMSYIDSLRDAKKPFNEKIPKLFSYLDITMSGGLKWAFARSSKKYDAEYAYSELSDLYRDYYACNIEHALTDLKRIWMESDEGTLAPADQHEMLQLLVTMASSIDGCPACIGRFASNKSSLIKTKDNIESISKKYYKDIRKIVNRYVKKELEKKLYSIPVEELGGENRDFYVKVMRKKGFTTVADVYGWPVENICLCMGLTLTGAHTIKKAASKYAASVRKTIRVRLDADERDDKSTELVLALAKYQECRKLADRFNQCFSEQSDRERGISSDVQMLAGLGNCMTWIVMDDAEKQKVIDAFGRVRDFMQSERGVEFSALSKALHDLPKLSKRKAWNDFIKNPIFYYNLLEEVVPGVLGNADEFYGLPRNLGRKVQSEELPLDGLRCTLRRYQEWGVKYILHQGKVLLGDEMGLGKTVQAIAVMVSLRNMGARRFIVVCPASVVVNWCKEIERHSSILWAIKIHGPGRATALESWQRTGGVAVTTYETLASLKLSADFAVDLVIVDEAHYIKNPKTARSRNVRTLCERSERLLFMTGTALENKVDDMLSLVEILQPSLVPGLQKLSYMPSAPLFRQKLAPVYYRRKREDVLAELPKLVEKRQWCTMTVEERAVYEEAVLDHRLSDARRVSWNIADLERSTKVKRLREIVDEAAGDGRKVIVFSFFLDTIGRIRQLLGSRCTEPITGSVPAVRRQQIVDEFDQAESGKVLLAQIQTGGTGLNIQSASVVIICEPQLKPSTENQAISRAYRMGQTRSVFVHRLLCTGTVDERFTKLLEEKQRVFDAFADKSVAAAEDIHLDKKAVGAIIDEEIERIKARQASTPNPSKSCEE